MEDRGCSIYPHSGAGEEDDIIANRFVNQATQQVAPTYAGAINAEKAQIPAIQQLYDTLTSGLQQQNQQQLNTGVQNIVEDASARGVLRSTLPVDARQTLTAQLGAALNQSLGQLGVQRTQDLAGVRSNIAQLRIQRANQIQELAQALQSGNLSERQFRFQVKQADRQYALDKQQLALQASRGGGGGRAPTAAEINLMQGQQQKANINKIMSNLSRVTGSDGYVSPDSYRAAKSDWARLGYDLKDFDNYFSVLKNPNNPNYR